MVKTMNEVRRVVRMLLAQDGRPVALAATTKAMIVTSRVRLRPCDKVKTSEVTLRRTPPIDFTTVSPPGVLNRVVFNLTKIRKTVVLSMGMRGNKVKVASFRVARMRLTEVTFCGLHPLDKLLVWGDKNVTTTGRISRTVLDIVGGRLRTIRKQRDNKKEMVQAVSHRTRVVRPDTEKARPWNKQSGSRGRKDPFLRTMKMISKIRLT